MRKITLKLLDGRYAIARLAATDAIPSWADGAGFVTISRSEEELSIVCLEQRVPQQVQAEHDWACFRLVGPFAFDEPGIVLAVVQPLSEGGIGVFVVSTFDGDHFLIKRGLLERAASLLQQAGHTLLD